MAHENDLDLPFEPAPPGQTLELTDARLSGGLVVMSVAVPAGPHGEVMPGLVFRFAADDGSGFYPPMLLVVPPDQMTKLAQLVVQAADAATKAAS